MPFTGDTIRLKATFYNFGNELVDPDSVSVTVYDGKRNVLETGAGTRESLGVYWYDYTIPPITTGHNDPLVYEFTGIIDGKPSLGRSVINREWV